MKYDNREITQKDLEKVTNILVDYYWGCEKFPGDCWIASYCDDKPGVLFENCYNNLAEFWADNNCFAKEIIYIEKNEGIA